MRCVAALVTGSMLLQFGGCSLGSLMKFAERGFAEALGAYGAGLLLDQILGDDGPGPLCIGPGCPPQDPGST